MTILHTKKIQPWKASFIMDLYFKKNSRKLVRIEENDNLKTSSPSLCNMPGNVNI